MKSEIFPHLVIGLAEFLGNKNRIYPYPDTLRYSLNKLALALLSDYPKTVDSLIQLFGSPLSHWWPSGELPVDFEPDEPLIEYGELSAEAMAYLDKLAEIDNSPLRDSLAHIGIIDDNRKFRQLLDRLNEKSLIDSDGAQRDYITLRRFIIECPYALARDIGQVFSQTEYVTSREVNELYVDTNEIADILEYPKDGQQVFWLCEHCGPLRVKQGQRESIKRTVCGKHCPSHRNGWKTITPSRQLRVLRKGVHLRVCLPGIQEIALFKWLEERQQEYPNFLSEVKLWPRIDTYDLQIRFVDAIWAVDIKDYENPELLGRRLTELNQEGDLRWDKGFYIYPSYREQQRRDYGETVRYEALPILKGIEIISDRVFKEQVTNKLHAMRRDNR